MSYFIKLFKNEYFWLGLILIFGFYVRFYGIDNPVADWHSWRQADTAAVTRNFIKDGLNPFMPKYDDLSVVSSVGYANPGGYRFVEFPIYNLAVYPFYLMFGIDEFWHRLVSVVFSMVSVILLYLIVKRYEGVLLGLMSAFVFAFIPYNIFFSRVILPEPMFLFLSLGMLYFTVKWIEEQSTASKYLGLVFTALSFLIKPWAIFFILPLAYAVYAKEGNKFRSYRKYLLYLLIFLIPFMMWRLWILQFPEGIPANGWLLNSDGIRFRPAFWWWIISERLGREILGVAGFGLFLIGILIRSTTSRFFYLWLIAIAIYVVTFATGNIRHDYYQIITTPILAIFVAKGFMLLFKGLPYFIPRIFTILIAVLFLLLTFYFGWTQIKGLYQINNPVIISAGTESDKLLPKDARVIAPYNGDTAFLYQTNRPGWPVITPSIRDLIYVYGTDYYISTTNDARTSWAKRHFKIVKEEFNYVIIDLTQLTNNFSEQDPEPK